jgi:hypothetical protein
MNPKESAAVPDVKEEEWTISNQRTDCFDYKWASVEDGLGNVIVDTSEEVAKAFKDAHNASIQRVLEKKEAVADSVEATRQNELPKETRAITCPKCDPERNKPDYIQGWRDSLKYLIFDSLRCRICRTTLIDLGTVPDSCFIPKSKRAAISVSDGGGSDKDLGETGGGIAAIREGQKDTLLKHAATLLRASRYALRKMSLNPEVDHAGYFDSVCKLIAVIEGHHDAPSVVDGSKSANAAGVSSPNSVPANAQGPMEGERYTLEQLKSNRELRESLAGNWVRIWQGDHGGAWWRPPANGYTIKREEAAVYPFDRAWLYSSHCGPEKQISYDIHPSVIKEQPAVTIQAAADHEGLLQCRALLKVQDGDNLYDAIKRLLEEKEAATRNTLNLQMALGDLQQIRETLPTDWFFERRRRASHALANLAEALEDFLSEADGQPEGASGLSLDDETCHCGQPMKTHDQSHDPRPLSAGYPKSERRIHEC